MATLLSVKQDVAALSEGVRAQSEEQGSLAAKVAQFKARFAPTPVYSFVSRSGKRQYKVHRVMLDGMHLLPQQWRTACGVRFGLWAFLRHASVDGFPPDARCATSFGRACAGGSDEASSSSSSSAEE